MNMPLEYPWKENSCRNKHLLIEGLEPFQNSLARLWLWSWLALSSNIFVAEVTGASKPIFGADRDE